MCGEPVDQQLQRRIVEVYPRVCGGTSFSPSRTWTTTGLSPRVRGNPDGRADDQIDHRSIPACAGGTLAVDLTAELVQGLSPRVRGNLTHVLVGWMPARSIPACAGEPVGDQAVAFPDEVYPRVCGGTGRRW